jgi:hypothetical protein
MSNPLVLQPINGEPRIRDLDLAERLGFELPYDIRKIIKRNMDNLLKFGVVATVAKTSGEQGGRPSVEYSLNRQQAIFLCMKSETDNAVDVQVEVVRVFDAYQSGTLEYQPGKTPSVGEYAMLSARALMEHEHRLDAQDQRLDGMNSEIIKLKSVISQATQPQPTHDLFSSDLPIRQMPEGYSTVVAYIKEMGIKIEGKRCGMISRHCGIVCKNRNIPVFTPNPIDQPMRRAYPREVIAKVLDEELKLYQGKGDGFRAYLQEGAWVKQRLLATRLKWGQSKVRVGYLLEKMGFLFRLPNGEYIPTESALDICREDEDGELQWQVVPLKNAYDEFTQKFQPRRM